MNLHPLHEAYVKTFTGNTLNRLFRLLDGLQPTKLRDETVILLAITTLKLKVRESVSVHDILGERLEEHLSYSKFKDAAKDLSKSVPEALLVSGLVRHIVGIIGNYAFRNADDTVAQLRSEIAHWNEKISQETEDWKKQSLQGLVDMSQKKLKTAHEDLAAWQSFYYAFCERVIGGLLKEQEEISEQVRRNFVVPDDLSTEEFPGSQKEPGGDDLK